MGAYSSSSKNQGKHNLWKHHVESKPAFWNVFHGEDETRPGHPQVSFKSNLLLIGGSLVAWGKVFCALGFRGNYRYVGFCVIESLSVIFSQTSTSVSITVCSSLLLSCFWICHELFSIHKGQVIGDGNFHTRPSYTIWKTKWRNSQCVGLKKSGPFASLLNLGMGLVLSSFLTLQRFHIKSRVL